MIRLSLFSLPFSLSFSASFFLFFFSCLLFFRRRWGTYLFESEYPFLRERRRHLADFGGTFVSEDTRNLLGLCELREPFVRVLLAAPIYGIQYIFQVFKTTLPCECVFSSTLIFSPLLPWLKSNNLRFQKGVSAKADRNCSVKSTNRTEQSLIPCWSLPWDLFKKVHSGFRKK